MDICHFEPGHSLLVDETRGKLQQTYRKDENINPETLPSHSHSLRAADFYVQGLQFLFQARYYKAKYVTKFIF